jgi:tetratricopeptide (TPR) repeat protein
MNLIDIPIRLQKHQVALLSIAIAVVALVVGYRDSLNFKCSFEGQPPRLEYEKSCDKGFASLCRYDFHGALDEFDRASKLPEADQLGFIGRGIALFSLRNPQQAIQCFDQALKLAPHSTAALIDRGIARVEIGDYVNALADYDRALAIDPSNAAAYNNRAVVLDRLGDKEAAIFGYSKALQLKHWAIVRLNRAFANAELGLASQAKEDCDQSMQWMPSLEHRWGQKALVKTLIANMAKWSSQIKANPSDPTNYIKRGGVRHELRDFVGAAADYTKAISIDPDNAESYSERSFDRAILDDNQGALEDISKFYELRPEHTYCLGWRGSCKARVGDRQGAIEDFSAAIRALPDCEWWYKGRAREKFQSGHYLDAAADYIHFLSLDYHPWQELNDLCLNNNRTLFTTQFRHDRNQIFEFSEQRILMAVQVCD